MPLFIRAQKIFCGDGIDQNCDGGDAVCPPTPEDVDDDGDTFTENAGDCDDADAAINPGAEDVCGDGIDQNCDGAMQYVRRLPKMWMMTAILSRRIRGL